MTNLDKRVEDAFPIISRVMAELENAPKEEPINELEPDAEPIDAPIEPPMDHGAVVQSFLTDPDNKLVLRKDDSADKMLKVTKFKDKSTMLGSILSDIASRMLTKTGAEDRVANFASRVADGLEQEGSGMFKPGPDYNKNKKIAVQLAKRYIDDFKKMQSDPKYADEVRMDPADYNPKKDLKGKAKETEAFENWIDDTINEYTKTPRDEEDRREKLKVLNQIQSNPDMMADPKIRQAVIRRRMELARKDPATTEQMSDKEVDKFHTELDKVVHKHIGHSSDEKKEKEEMQKEEVFPEGTTFEDIKPYVSMYKDEKTGKTVNDVLDKDGKSVFKTTDAKKAMAYLSKNYDKLRIGRDESQAEQSNPELDRIKTLANIS